MKIAVLIAGVLIAGLIVFRFFRRRTDDGSETINIDGIEINIGPGIELSGPELLAMLEAEGEELDPDGEYLYIEIPDPVMPVERGNKYEDPLEETLAEHALGTVTGGGSMMNNENEIDYVGLDVSVSDLDKSLPIIAARLRELGAPQGTIIRYGDDESKSYDIWENRR